MDNHTQIAYQQAISLRAMRDVPAGQLMKHFLMEAAYQFEPMLCADNHLLRAVITVNDAAYLSDNHWHQVPFQEYSIQVFLSRHPEVHTYQDALARYEDRCKELERDNKILIELRDSQNREIKQLKAATVKKGGNNESK